jgi:alginate production protein
MSRLVCVVTAVAVALAALPADTVCAEENRDGGRPPSVGTLREKAFDPGAPPRTTIRLTPFLSFGGRLRLDFERQQNFDLDEARPDDLSTLEQSLSLAVSFHPNRHFQTYINVGFSKTFPLEDDGPEEERPTALELELAYVSLKAPADAVEFQIGRQRFRDEREWLYDEKLDAARLLFRVSNIAFDLSVSREGVVPRDLLNEEPEERVNNYLLYGTYAFGRKTRIAAYGLVRDDRSSARQRPIFLGLHSSGELVDDLDHWLELAHVRGRDGSRKIRGYGLDLGVTYAFPFPWRPSATVGYAFGTGDPDTTDAVDRRFRQTGLEDNAARFNGVTRFKYYGELLDPELSNLSIVTAGIGVRPTRRSSIDAVYHRYAQDEPARRIRGAEIERRPTGRSRELGEEIDLIVGYREIRNVDMELTLGYFLPGGAFPAGADESFLANVKVQFSF